MSDTSFFKVFTFFGMWAVLWLPITLLIARLIDWQPNQPLIPKQKLILLASLYILVPLIMWWKINEESLSFASLGLNWQPSTFTSLALGLVFSIASLAIVFGLESLFGLINWHWENSELLGSLLLPILALSLFISSIEELVFRGYVFSTLTIDYPNWLAATISSAIFALLHLIWERKQTLPQLPGLWLMGMVLVGARLASGGSLGLASGLHAGWIWGLTCLDSAQLITYPKKEQSWITGINHQPLAGVAGIFCLILTAISLCLLIG